MKVVSQNGASNVPYESKDFTIKNITKDDITICQVICNGNETTNEIRLGNYSSPKKALKVLADMVKYKDDERTHFEGNYNHHIGAMEIQYTYKTNTHFQMPLDKDVEVSDVHKK